MIKTLILYLSGKEPNSPWQEPKFPTECFTVTVYCHHLSILPAVRKHQRCLRAIRELSRIVEEMENSESLWRHLPTASRNREIMKKYKSQYQVKDYFIMPPLEEVGVYCLAHVGRSIGR